MTFHEIVRTKGITNSLNIEKLHSLWDSSIAICNITIYY